MKNAVLQNPDTSAILRLQRTQSIAKSEAILMNAVYLPLSDWKVSAFIRKMLSGSANISVPGYKMRL